MKRIYAADIFSDATAVIELLQIKGLSFGAEGAGNQLHWRGRSFTLVHI